MAKKKRNFDEAKLKRVRKAVVKTPRTAAEIGERQNPPVSGRGVAIQLGHLVGTGAIKKIAGYPPTYQAAS